MSFQPDISPVSSPVPGRARRPRFRKTDSRLLAAATELFRSGGPRSVTIGALLDNTGVARATFYRHFTSSDDLLAATLLHLLPPAATSPRRGSLRQRLRNVTRSQSAALIADPIGLVAMAWLAVGGHLPGLPWTTTDEPIMDPHVGILRDRVIDCLTSPFAGAMGGDLDSVDVHCKADVSVAVPSLLGPVAFARLSGMSTDYRALAEEAVNSYLAVRIRGRRSN